MNNNTVTIVPLDEYEPQAARNALEKLLEPLCWRELVKPGMTVGIKVNLISAMKPDTAATTHPVLVRALCEMLVEHGAKVVIGDSPGGPFTSLYLNRVYSVSGMSDCVMDGVTLNHNFESARCGGFDGAVSMRDFEYTAWVDDVDVLIDFAKLKSHGMMSLSAAVKNLFGCIPGTVKPEYHYRFPNARDFANMLIDIDEFLKPVLSVVDGVVAMEGNGPTMGKPRKVGALIASRSPYACDRVCAGIIGLDEDTVPTLAMARERGLCPALEDIPVDGDLEAVRLSDFDNVERLNSIEFLTDLVGIKGKIWGTLLKKAMCSRPKLVPKKCVGCGKCRDICPAKAIEMKNGKPSIDRDKCIRCFCCQEFCPKGALRVHRPAIARVISKF